MQTGQVQKEKPDMAVLGQLKCREIYASFEEASTKVFGCQPVTTFSSQLHLPPTMWRAVFEFLWQFIVLYGFMVLSVRFTSFATNCLQVLIGILRSLRECLGTLCSTVAACAQAVIREAKLNGLPPPSSQADPSEAQWSFGYVSISMKLPDWQAMLGYQKLPESGTVKTSEQQQTNVTFVLFWCLFKLVLILGLVYIIVCLIKQICTRIGLDKAAAYMLDSISRRGWAQKVQKIKCTSQVHRLLGTVWRFIKGRFTFKPIQILFEQIARVCSAETITSNNCDPVSEEELVPRIPKYVYNAYRSLVKKAFSPDATQAAYRANAATRECLENWHLNTNESKSLGPLIEFFKGVQHLRLNTFDTLFQPNFNISRSPTCDVICKCLPGFVEGMCPRLSSVEFREFKPSKQVQRRSAQSKEACENANLMIHKVTKWWVPLVTFLLLVILSSLVYYLYSFLGGFGFVSSYTKVFTSAISNTTRVTKVRWTVHGDKTVPQARAFAQYVSSPRWRSQMTCLHTDYKSNQYIRPDKFEVHKYRKDYFLAKSKEIRTFYSTQANVSETCQTTRQKHETEREKRPTWYNVLVFLTFVSEDFPDIICNDIPLPDKLTMDKFNVDCFQSIEFQGFEILDGYTLADAPIVLNLLIGLCTEVGLWLRIVGITFFAGYAIQYCLLLAHKICVYYLMTRCC